MQKVHDERFQRVSPKHPCPICGHTDWCSFTSYLVVCMRVPSDKPANGGGYKHKPGGDWSAPKPEPELAPDRVPLAPVEVRDRWYRGLLALLQLNPAHQQNLLGRGISAEIMAMRQYRSLPLTGRVEICQRLITRLGGTPEGVPGFYQHPKTGSWLLAGAAGMLIPVMDRNGRILGMQVRRDQPSEDGNRYSWVSSARKGPGGSSSGTPLHTVLPLNSNRVSETVWITEGPLKADRLCAWKQAPVIATPGVAARKGIVEELMALGARNVVVAYDMDREAKAEVRQALELLIQELLAAGFRVSLASWDPKYKGIDDALNGKATIKVSRAA